MKVYLVIQEYHDYDFHSSKVVKALYHEEKAKAYADKYSNELTLEEKVDKACDDYRYSQEIMDLCRDAPKFELERPRIDQARKHDKEYVKTHEKACHQWNAERIKWGNEVGNPYHKEWQEKHEILMSNYRAIHESVQKDTFEKRPDDDNNSFSVQAIEIED